ncbi:MAG: TonB-dependent receptor, partial [Psychrosphaera sp.]|nr:TonB-dependent receptor [Psychrosphaera sp.]
HGDLEIAAAGRYFKTDGWDISSIPATGPKFTDSAFSESPSFLITAKFKDFYLTTSYGEADQYTQRGNDTIFLSGSVANTNFFLDVGFDHTFDNDWQLKTSASYVALRTTDFDDLNQGGPPTVLQPVEYQSDDARLEITSQGPLSDKVNLLVGGTVDYFSGKVKTPASVTPFAPDWEDYLFGLYGQVDYQLGNTKFVAGAQYNKPESAPGKLVPRLAVIHNFTNHFGVKALYGQAFRAPFAFEKDSTVTSGVLKFLGNSSLEHELVTNYDLQFFYERDQLQASVTFFKSKQEDLIDRIAINATDIVFQNKNSLDIKGVEIESKFTFKDNWYFTGSFSYQTNEDGDGVKNFTLQPNRIFKFGLGYTEKDWSIGVFDSYFDQYLDNTLITTQSQKINPSSKAYHNLSIKASMTLPNFYGIKLNAYADNLLDEDVFLPVHTNAPNFTHNTTQAQSGRFFMLGLTIPF